MQVNNNEERYKQEQHICTAYNKTFSTEAGATVLTDLSNFCGADKLCFHQDARQEAFMLGARSVILYIRERMNGTSLKRLRLQSESGVTDKEIKVNMNK